MILKAKAPVFAVKFVLDNEGDVKCSKNTFALLASAIAELELIFPLNP